MVDEPAVGQWMAGLEGVGAQLAHGGVAQIAGPGEGVFDEGAVGVCQFPV